MDEQLEQLSERLESTTASVIEQDTRLQIAEKEIESLRKDRHDHGTTLQIHKLELELLKQAVSGGHTVLDKLAGTSEKHERMISDLKSDVRILLWKVGILTGAASGVIAVVLNYVINHLAP